MPASDSTYWPLKASTIPYLLMVVTLSVCAWAQVDGAEIEEFPTTRLSEMDAGASSSRSNGQSFISNRSIVEQQKGVDWWGLTHTSLLFLSVENAFRCATEQGTRDGFGNPFFHGYLDAVGNLHGWGDGDPFYVNYIGHPLQGAVSSFIWQHNDRAYKDAVFGRNSKYWKGRLRGTAFAYVYSVLFEIGPISEASIGNIQAYYPEQGFVDHIVTPVIGTGWAIAEDTVDRYFVGYVERRTTNNMVRRLVRTWANPGRSMANLMGVSMPWHRDDRPNVDNYYPHDRDFMMGLQERNTASAKVNPPAGVAPFEVTVLPQFRTYLGEKSHGACAGGGGDAALRLAPDWQFVVNVSGCKLLGLTNLTGDSLSYLAGVRKAFAGSSRWSGHTQLLIGGTKLTQERVDGEKEQLLNQQAAEDGGPKPLHSAYSQHWEANGFTVQVGGGVDLKLNNALSLRMVDLGFSHSWSNELNGTNYQSTLQFTSGLILRMGTW